MCYDISFQAKVKELSAYFPGLIYDDQVEINFNAAIHIIGHAFGEHPVIYKNSETGMLHARLMEWGVIPFYVKEEQKFLRQRASMLNARSERILEDKTSYWHKIKNRRCLIPVSGFYEHREIKGWKKKVPYFIELKKQKMFFLPGLYSVAEIPDKETGELIKRFTFTLITRPANSAMRGIHNGGDNAYRMPLMLPFELSLQWLADLDENNIRDILNYEMPSAELDYWPVYTIRSPKPRPDDKPKDAIYKWENLPALSAE